MDPQYIALLYVEIPHHLGSKSYFSDRISTAGFTRLPGRACGNLYVGLGWGGGTRWRGGPWVPPSTSRLQGLGGDATEAGASIPVTAVGARGGGDVPAAPTAVEVTGTFHRTKLPAVGDDRP